MNLHSIRQAIIESTSDDWNVIQSWDSNSGPDYHYGLSSELRDDRIETEVRRHGQSAVLINDVDISIAWGYDPDDSLSHPGLKNFNFEFLPDDLDDPDEASRMYADIFYRGALVDRKLFAVVDGARYYVPMPRRTHPNKQRPTKLGDPVFHYTTWDIGLARVLNSLVHTSDIDELFSRMDYVVD